MNDITLSQLTAIASALNGTTTSGAVGGSPYKIVVLDRGFVVHGRVRKEGAYIVIDECNQIRAYGTPRQNNDSSLGYLARLGPTKDTKLDLQPTTRVHELQVVQMIDCEKQEAWNAR